MTLLGSQEGRCGPSVKPRSAAPWMTWPMTVSVLTAVSTMSGDGWPGRLAAARKEASQVGSSCSAMVELD